jgi:hypothetical protein
MYPAQALVDGFYSAIDLPDAVTIDGVSFNRSGTGYGNTTNGVLYEDGVWARYTNGERNERACLIQGGVVDQFADTYTITPPFGNSYARPTAVSRISLCNWEGVDDCGNLVSLFYDSFFIWFITVPIYEQFNGCIPNESFFDGLAQLAKDESQIGRGSSPAGLYPSVDFGADFTVS